MEKKISTREVSNKSEKIGAKAIGMRQQTNSGSTRFAKGDLVDDYTLLDDKTMMNIRESVSLNIKWFRKIKEESFSMNKRFSGIRFNFGEPKISFIAVSEVDFVELYNAWKELHGDET